MKRKPIERAFVLIALLGALRLCTPERAAGQVPVTAPPNILVLVDQQFKPADEGTREKLASQIAQACSQFDVPNQWIELQSITGVPRTLSFDSFDSFAQIDDAAVGWPRVWADHPDLSQLQGQLRELVKKERTIIAERRSDLSFEASSIDLSKMRYMRVLEVHLQPGHEADFVEAFKTLRAAYAKIKADTPWVVYQVNLGTPTPAFLAFVPMRALRQNDDLLTWRPLLREAEGEVAAKRMDQIAKEAYASTESNLYAVRPDLSHVFKDFADGDPDFWTPRPAAFNVLRNPAAKAAR